jgi:hypothetical protein
MRSTTWSNLRKCLLGGLNTYQILNENHLLQLQNFGTFRRDLDYFTSAVLHVYSGTDSHTKSYNLLSNSATVWPFNLHPLMDAVYNCLENQNMAIHNRVRLSYAAIPCNKNKLKSYCSRCPVMTW